MNGLLKEAITTHVLKNSCDYPADEPIHTCPYCGREVPLKLIEVDNMGTLGWVQPKCKCEVQHWNIGYSESIRKHEMEEFKNKFGIYENEEDILSKTFASFKQRKGSEEAYKRCVDYALRFDDLSVGLYIHGEPGNGKSHLAKAITNEVRKKRKNVVFIKTPMLMERIRATFNKSNRTSEQQIMTALYKCDLLILDDIGAENVTDFVRDVLFRVYDQRVETGKKIISTSNFSPIELKDRFGGGLEGQRIIDRIMESSLLVHNQAQSYRIEMAIERQKAR